MIEAQAFLDVVRPVLSQTDPAALARAVQVRWRPRQIARLLRHDQAEVRRVVAFTLGLVGDETCIGPLTRALHDNDWRVNEMAENALWSIWFRRGDPKAAGPFHRGVRLLENDAYPDAVAQFRQAIDIDPSFAEAFNQCAMAHYFLGQWREAITDACRAVQLEPAHFGAFATLGHCYTQLNDLDRAVQCYRRALRINPRMSAVACAADHLSIQLQEMCNSSGRFTAAGDSSMNWPSLTE